MKFLSLYVRFYVKKMLLNFSWGRYGFVYGNLRCGSTVFSIFYSVISLEAVRYLCLGWAFQYQLLNLSHILTCLNPARSLLFRLSLTLSVAFSWTWSCPHCSRILLTIEQEMCLLQSKIIRLNCFLMNFRSFLVNCQIWDILEERPCYFFLVFPAIFFGLFWMTLNSSLDYQVF